MAGYEEIEAEFLSLKNDEKAQHLMRFFKTGPGMYGEGDRFLGLVVPQTRALAIRYGEVSYETLTRLLDSPYHEMRLCALLVLVQRFKKRKTAEERQQIYHFYLAHTARINNWDLVDLSAKEIVGGYLLDKERAPLYRLAESTLLWEQRIAIIATHTFIRKYDLADAFALSEKLLYHSHDLMHKAVGWTLREAGKKDKESLCRFLDRYAITMPRTTLRYAIEKMSPEDRRYYMTMKEP